MLDKQQVQEVIRFVKHEPRTVQDISRLIKRSWVTTDSYLKRIKEDTGMIDIKTFRKGSQGALKIVFYSNPDISRGDELMDDLFGQIRSARKKTDFDFFEVFQHIDDKKKKVIIEEFTEESRSKEQKLSNLLRQAKHSVYIFSGNLSFINLKEKKTKILSVIEELIKRKVLIKIICRVNISSMSNISKLSSLLKSDFIEIKHHFQPLRGYIIDDDIARFKSEEILKDYKPGELDKNLRIFYEFYDDVWISWLERVFWNLFRHSIDHSDRVKQLKKFF